MVYGNIIPVGDLNLSATSLVLDLGQKVALSANVLPENADNKNLKWKSSDPEVAIVDANGQITAVGDGTAIITVETTDGSGIAKSCQVSVNGCYGVKIKKCGIEAGKTTFVPIFLTNSSRLSSFSFDLHLPAGISPKLDAEGLLKIEMGLVDDDVSDIECIPVEDGVYNFLFRASTDKGIAPGECVIAQLPLVADTNLSLADSIHIINQMFVTTDQQQKQGANSSAAISVIIPGQYKYFLLEVNKIKGDRTIQIGEFALLDDRNREIEGLVCFAGTNSSHNPKEENWDHLTDHLASAKYCNISFSNPAYFYFEIDHLIHPSGYRIYTANDDELYPNRHPVSWKLYGSPISSIDPLEDFWVLLDLQEDCTVIQAKNTTPYDFNIEYKDDTDGINAVSVESAGLYVFTTSGNLVKIISSFSDLSLLPKGLYIVNGKKFIVK